MHCLLTSISGLSRTRARSLLRAKYLVEECTLRNGLVGRRRRGDELVTEKRCKNE